MITDERALNGELFYYVSSNVRLYKVLKAWRATRPYKRTRSMSSFAASPGDILVRMSGAYEKNPNKYTVPMSSKRKNCFFASIEEAKDHIRAQVEPHNPELVKYLFNEKEYFIAIMGCNNQFSNCAFIAKTSHVERFGPKTFGLVVKYIEQLQDGVHFPTNGFGHLREDDLKYLTPNYWEARASALKLMKGE